MTRNVSRVPELALPAASLVALRRALSAQVGADAAARALQHAGYAAADALYPLLRGAEAEEGGDGAAASDLGAATFWRRMAELFAKRGWGTLQHSQEHTGVGALASADWAEADPQADAARPTCFFTSGVLANLLGHAAGGSVSVLEVSCRSRGDTECRFLFGSDEALYTVYETLRAGHDVERTLAELV